ncbi:molybdopterin-dependent oxidoreductase [Gordonia sp. HNM0687]|uniref:Molybdopterin-dependent oxidoreductase n=1 Tax=Gordonia mangrovi TaxID=2665643 RepID=A0A6L7GIM1_9ACTN|nr:molybdopterin-dependent oxidoreductase [Gordonia mangrovi]MXP19779.1 molybdopterin-dependent oxidoreductase [Gordonia mangrovi]UVF79594.1 molybdopterin-dependent oxidoreductase [Gordonia mangrovi]
MTATDDDVAGLRSPRVTARIGVALGISFGICFATGLLSHGIQHPPSWFEWIARPVWLYRVTQGVHVISGCVAIPLLLAKLAVVYPKLFDRPLIGSPARALERLSIAVLVAAGIFQLLTGLLNIAQWYPWSFFFPSAHYAMAYVAIGALAIHIAVKLPVIRTALDGPVDSRPPERRRGPSGLSRRGFLNLTWVAGGLGALAFAGQTIPLLRPVAFLAPRSGDGPQGLPINRTAEAAGVISAATDADYRLRVTGAGAGRELSLTELRTLPQHTVDLPIACVEGWSVGATWTGVRVTDLAALVGGDGGRGIRVISLERGLYAVSTLPVAQSQDPLTLLALELNGEPLDIDHGYPGRLIAPNLPGVMQTKWVSRIEVL